MTQRWPYIRVICGFCSARSGHDVLVDRFQVRGDRWVRVGDKVRPNTTLRENAVQSVDDLFSLEHNPTPIRNVVPAPCRSCGRKLERKEDRLESELYMLAHLKILKVEVEAFSRLDTSVLIRIAKAGLMARTGLDVLTAEMVEYARRLPDDSPGATTTDD